MGSKKVSKFGRKEILSRREWSLKTSDGHFYKYLESYLKKKKIICEKNSQCVYRNFLPSRPWEVFLNMFPLVLRTPQVLRIDFPSFFMEFIVQILLVTCFKKL